VGPADTDASGCSDHRRAAQRRVGDACSGQAGPGWMGITRLARGGIPTELASRLAFRAAGQPDVGRASRAVPLMGTACRRSPGTPSAVDVPILGYPAGSPSDRGRANLGFARAGLASSLGPRSFVGRARSATSSSRGSARAVVGCACRPGRLMDSARGRPTARRGPIRPFVESARRALVGRRAGSPSGSGRAGAVGQRLGGTVVGFAGGAPHRRAVVERTSGAGLASPQDRGARSAGRTLVGRAATRAAGMGRAIRAGPRQAASRGGATAVERPGGRGVVRPRRASRIGCAPFDRRGPGGGRPRS
jgi:hypothetical protein